MRRRLAAARISRLFADLSALDVRSARRLMGVIPAVRGAESPEIRGWSAAIKPLFAIASNRSHSPQRAHVSQHRGEK